MTRMARAAETIKKAISHIILSKVSDPRIGFVSLTDVEISPDLRSARVFVSVLGTKEQQEKSVQGLNSAAAFIREELKEHIKIRHLPRLHFVYDPSLERGCRVSNILSQLSHEKNLSKNKKAG